MSAEYYLVGKVVQVGKAKKFDNEKVEVEDVGGTGLIILDDDGKLNSVRVLDLEVETGKKYLLDKVVGVTTTNRIIVAGDLAILDNAQPQPEPQFEEDDGYTPDEDVIDNIIETKKSKKK